MNCDCGKEAQVMCKNCPIYRFFCDVHLLMHIRETSHPIHPIDQRVVKEESIRSLGICINNYISQILLDTQNIISMLLEASKESIKRLKTMKKSIKNITDLRLYWFDRKTINCFIQETNMIIQGLKNSSESQVCNSMRIIVKNLNGKEIHLNVEPLDSISTVKHKVKDKEGISIEEQTLVYRGKQLQDERSLDYFNVRQDSILWLVLRPR